MTKREWGWGYFVRFTLLHVLTYTVIGVIFYQLQDYEVYSNTTGSYLSNADLSVLQYYNEVETRMVVAFYCIVWINGTWFISFYPRLCC